MEFKEAKASDVRMKMALAGKSGAGKTVGALLIAKGLVGGLENVGVLQTEAGRAQCYLHLGKFKVLDVSAPFSPQKFIQAIEVAEKSGLKCLIIDSISDQWEGTGGILDIHQQASEVTKNSFTAWKKVTPQHDAVFEKIMTSPIHLIATVRKKVDHVMENVGGKQVIKKVGTKDIAREGTEYKWIIQLDLDQEGNMAHVSKDNSGLFQGKPPFKITEETGKKIRDWCLGVKA